jgi:hypothetical protein
VGFLGGFACHPLTARTVLASAGSRVVRFALQRLPSHAVAKSYAPPAAPSFGLRREVQRAVSETQATLADVLNPPTHPPAHSRAAVPVNDSSRPHAQVVSGRDAQTTLQLRSSTRAGNDGASLKHQLTQQLQNLEWDITVRLVAVGLIRAKACAQLEPPSLSRC